MKTWWINIFTFFEMLAPSPASTPQTHTRQQKRLSLLNDFCPSPPPAHTNFFPIPITTNAQVFLSHNCPKIKENPKVLKVHINRIQLYPKKSMQTKAITWMCWLQEPFAFHYLQVSRVSLSLKTRTRKIYRHCFLILWRSAELFNEILPQNASSTGGLWGGGGEWTIGRRWGHNRGEINKIVVDNSKMVMYCQRTAKTCEGNENRKHLNLSPTKP